MSRVRQMALALGVAALVMAGALSAHEPECLNGSEWDCSCLLNACAARCGSSGVSNFECNPSEGETSCICVP